jgi:hypothetical protein
MRRTSRGGRIWCDGRGASARAGAELGEAVAAAAAVAKVVAIGLATRAASCWNMASYPLLEDGPLNCDKRAGCHNLVYSTKQWARHCRTEDAGRRLTT